MNSLQNNRCQAIEKCFWLLEKLSNLVGQEHNISCIADPFHWEYKERISKMLNDAAVLAIKLNY